MNVVVVILDSLRKDHIGAYGNPWIKTPNLDALARESLRFSRAYPESLPTICARRAIHTGKRSFPFKDRPSEQANAPSYGWLPIPPDQPTLAETLEAAGYQTMLVTDTYHQFRPPMDFNRGFKAYRWIRGQENDPYKPPLPPPTRRCTGDTSCTGKPTRPASTWPTPGTERTRRTGSPPRCSSGRRSSWRGRAGGSRSF